MLMISAMLFAILPMVIYTVFANTLLSSDGDKQFRDTLLEVAENERYTLQDVYKRQVITRPDTPSAWANYLGDPEYGAIISNNAGGYSFVKSGANGRVIRYRFNGVGTDTPGRYVYLRDLETNDYWSASWAPVCKPLDQFKSECRHGTAYTVITSEYKGVKSEVTYYVPQGATYEVWAAKVTNLSLIHIFRFWKQSVRLCSGIPEAALSAG